MMAPEQVARTCPVCGAAQTRPYLLKEELCLVRCGQCDMVYANPVSRSLVSGDFYDQSGEVYYLSGPKLKADYADVRFDRELKLLRAHCERGRILDVGCSSGAFLYQLRKRYPGNYEVLGADVSGPALDYAESMGVPVLRGDLLNHDLANRSFTAVTFWAVLEHLVEPRRFLEKAHALLEPAGLCFVLVPNLNSLAVRLLGQRYRYILPQHVNYFTRATLLKLVQPRFEVVQVRTTHFNPVVIWQDWRQRGRPVTDLDRAALLARTTRYKQNRALWPLRVVYRSMERTLGLIGLADNLVVVLGRRD